MGAVKETAVEQEMCIRDRPIQAQEIELKPDPSVQEKGSIHVELEETKDRLSRDCLLYTSLNNVEAKISLLFC